MSERVTGIPKVECALCVNLPCECRACMGIDRSMTCHLSQSHHGKTYGGCGYNARCKVKCYEHQGAS